MEQGSSALISKHTKTTGSLPNSGHEDINLDGEVLPSQLIIEILLRADNPLFVISSCTLVCRRWSETLKSSFFWIEYMKYHGLIVPPPPLRNAEGLDMRRVCVKQPFDRNLIHNPSGHLGFEGWRILANGGDRFVIEKPPVSCSNALNDFESIDCAFVTSYGLCKKEYVIDLWNAGLSQEFLDNFHPPIVVSSLYNCRTDCGAEYTLEVDLMPDDGSSSIQTVDPANRRSRRRKRQLVLRTRRRTSSVDSTSDVSITRHCRMEQWSSAEWQRVEHTFSTYPSGIRYVVFTDAGKDTQFWAGHYGSKMARATVIVSSSIAKKEGTDGVV